MKREISTIDLTKELKKLWNMKMTVIPIIIGALCTDTKGFIQRLENLEISGRVETIQTTIILRSARILRRVMETWGDLLSLKLQRKDHQLTLMWKTLKELNNNNNNSNNNLSEIIEKAVEHEDDDCTNFDWCV